MPVVVSKFSTDHDLGAHPWDRVTCSWDIRNASLLTIDGEAQPMVGSFQFTMGTVDRTIKLTATGTDGTDFATMITVPLLSASPLPVDPIVRVDVVRQSGQITSTHL